MDEELHIIIRTALDADMQAIADAHRASILEIGPLYYPEDVVQDWGRPRDAARYRESRDVHGEVFFVAETVPPHPGYVHGFAGYRFENEKHALQALYVRGTSARRGIARGLLHAVEEHAKKAGATELHTEASLSGEVFYIASGFRELSRHSRVFSAGGVSAEAIMMMKLL